MGSKDQRDSDIHHRCENRKGHQGAEEMQFGEHFYTLGAIRIMRIDFDFDMVKTGIQLSLADMRPAEMLGQGSLN